MASKKEYLEIIIQTKEWFDKKIGQLQLITDEENDLKIIFAGKEGEKVELPDEHKKVKITKNNEDNQN